MHDLIAPKITVINKKAARLACWRLFEFLLQDVDQQGAAPS